MTFLLLYRSKILTRDAFFNRAILGRCRIPCHCRFDLPESSNCQRRRDSSQLQRSQSALRHHVDQQRLFQHPEFDLAGRRCSGDRDGTEWCLYHSHCCWGNCCDYFYAVAEEQAFLLIMRKKFVATCGWVGHICISKARGNSGAGTPQPLIRILFVT